MNIIDKKLSFRPMDIRNKTEQLVLHHSGVTVLQSVEVIHNYHKNTKGWSGIGYHFYVRKDGTIYRGRPENTVGAHAVGANYNSIGICFEGDFEKEIMGQAQLKAGQELITYLKSKYNISTVKRHKDVDTTECPGKNFPFEKMKNVSTNAGKKYTGTFPILPARGYFYYNGKILDKGTQVKYLQQFLNWSINARLSIDGYLGPATKKAILLYQKTYSLKQDGCFGPDCLRNAKIIEK